ncbi:hypothetical protein [uncultured Veillonella sp.]|uniref:hypothetical protein n=1 Tax=uncultured Veillonella sp. TaxID=159268 RepID=UPI0025FB0AE9|nr:hypothetical protein [uncultured Veillonella sp.]
MSKYPDWLKCKRYKKKADYKCYRIKSDGSKEHVKNVRINYHNSSLPQSWRIEAAEEFSGD